MFTPETIMSLERRWLDEEGLVCFNLTFIAFTAPLSSCVYIRFFIFKYIKEKNDIIIFLLIFAILINAWYYI